MGSDERDASPSEAAEPVELIERDDRVALRCGDLTLSFDPDVGALRRVSDASTDLSLPVTEPGAPPLTWTVGGRERRHPPQAALSYEGADTLGADLALEDATLLEAGRRPRVRVRSTTDDWRLAFTYAVDLDAARIEASFELVYEGDEDEVRIRRTRLPLRIGELGGEWEMDVPAAAFPPSTRLDGLDDGRVLEWGPRRIHTGLTGLQRPDGTAGLATWAFSSEWPLELAIDLETHDGSRVVSPEYECWTAARLSPGEGVSFEGVWLEIVRESWAEWLGSFQDWWDRVGLATPRDSPDWITDAAIFEAHVGHAKFRDGFEYAPYPEMDELIADLPRVADLGFDVVQLMPRHPLPSYVVVDDRHGGTAWGDPEDLARLVDAAHDADLRVVLDVVMHGVLDEDVLQRTRSSIEDNDLLGANPDKVAQYVEDHAEDWRGTLPERHSLVGEHPNWFVRDDDGDVAHRYTHALDLAIPAVQSLFVRKLRRLVEEYSVDGFRLDAPTWNQFPNWNAATGHPAGYAPLGGVALFCRSRAALREVDPEVALYVEAAGPLFRESSDVNYNYDEMWLLDAVFGGEATRFGDSVPQDVTASEMATWLDRRDQSLPAGSRTAHHVDSHDTFWWPDPGEKWFRERYGTDAAAAAIAVFALIDGAFMSYAGAEEGQEAFLSRILELRSSRPELARGGCEYLPDCCDVEGVFTALRRYGDEWGIVAVNLTDAAVETRLTPPVSTVPESRRVVEDHIGEERVSDDVTVGEPVEVSFAPYQPRLLVFPPEGTDGAHSNDT